MHRVLRWTLVGLAAVALAAYLALDGVTRRAIEAAAAQRTGFPLEIRTVRVGLLGGTFDVRDLRLSNPTGWPERRFVTLPLLHVDYHVLSLLGGSPHLRELVVRVDEVHVVTSADGVKNTTLLATRLTGEPGDAARDGARYRADVVRVHVGTLFVDDYSHGRHAQRRVVLNTDATYRDVTEATSLSGLVMGTVSGQLGSVAGDVAKGVGGALEGAGGAVNRSGQGLQDLFRKKR